MEGQALRVIDPQTKDLLREVENGIRLGVPVLLQDVLEEIDPVLEPLLDKAIQTVGNRYRCEREGTCHGGGGSES